MLSSELEGLVHQAGPEEKTRQDVHDDDDYNLFDDKLTARDPKESISLSDNITNHLGTQK